MCIDALPASGPFIDSTPEHEMTLHVYWPSACPRCHLKERCSPGAYRRIRRWEHEHILEAMQRRLDRKPDAMTIRRSTVEHVFGTLKQWMGATHFLTRTLGRVSTRSEEHTSELQSHSDLVCRLLL